MSYSRGWGLGETLLVIKSTGCSESKSLSEQEKRLFVLHWPVGEAPRSRGQLSSAGTAQAAVGALPLSPWCIIHKASAFPSHGEPDL